MHKKIFTFIFFLFLISFINIFPSSATEVDDIIGTYTGSYYATQGHTGLTLSIYEENDDLYGTFYFYAVPDNPKVPTGSYKCNVTYDKDTNIILVEGIEWIDRPIRWEFVTLDGAFNNGKYTGTVLPKSRTRTWTFALNLQKDENEISTWAEEDVNTAIIESLVPLEVQGEYTNEISRKNFTKLIVALLELYTDTEVEKFIQNYTGNLYNVAFSDTQDAGILSAGKLGIINGYGNGAFGPNDYLTREQAAVILTRLSFVLGNSISSDFEINYLDNDKISNWAYTGVASVSNTYDPISQKYIMAGNNDYFMPKEGYTVEQAIITIYRLMNAIK